MTTWFISRHPGAFEWAQEEGIDVDVRVEHLDVARIQAGDVVIGLLPLHLAAAVQRRGARYLHLSLEVPRECRGRELDARRMRLFGARLEEYVIHDTEAAC